MSNENNNGVIDFGDSNFVSENGSNATNPVSQDSTSNVTGNINVDDIFGSWDNSNTQSDATPVSNDYNNSNVNFNNGNSKEEGKVTSPSASDILGTGANDSQINDISIPGAGEKSGDNSELTKLAMDAFAGLTSNGVSLESQAQETSTVSSRESNFPVQSTVESENSDYMTAFANPFASLKSNQDQVSQSPMETTPVNTETENTNVQNSNQIAIDEPASLENMGGVAPVAGLDGSDLPSSSLENEESASSSNVVGDFNGFSDTGNNLENTGLENASSKENSPTANFENVSEDNGVVSDFTNPNPLDVATVFDSQPSLEFNATSPVAPAVDNQALPNIPDGFNSQFATPSREDVGTLNPLNTQTEANAEIQVAPVSLDGVSDNQVAVSVGANTESAAPSFDSTVAPDFNNDNLVNPDAGTFASQSNAAPTVTPATVDIQPVPNSFDQSTPLENTASSDFNANNQAPTDFNTGFNPEINNQISNNSTLNNQVANVSDNGSGTLNNNTITDNTVISPETNSNLQQVLSTPTNNVPLDNSISVGSIPNSQVIAPTVTDSNQENGKVPAKKQGKVSIPIVMLIIIIVFSVGIIILRRNELMDFFQTLMKK